MSNHILIIEDDTAIAQVLRLNLECADYTVTAFDNGLAAWNALASRPRLRSCAAGHDAARGGRLYACCRSFRNTESPSSA